MTAADWLREILDWRDEMLLAIRDPDATPADVTAAHHALLKACDEANDARESWVA